MDIRKSGLVTSGDSGAYSDLNRLNQLKVGNKNSDGNMRKVAQEFESLFLNEMLKSMRSATETLGQDNPLNTPAAKQYQEMYDQQLAVSMSRKGGGIGLADVLMRQMSKTKSSAAATATTLSGATEVAKTPTPTAIAAGTSAVGGPLTRLNGQRPLWASRTVDPPKSADGSAHNDMALLNLRRLSLPSKLTDRLLAGIVPSSATASVAANKTTLPSRTTVATDAVIKGDWQAAQSYAAPRGRMQIYGRAVAQPPLAPAKQAFSSADDFVATMLPMAQQAADRIGVDPRYLVAQAALETGW
ncbi:MAG: rod-binding protein, partial [Pseudomonas sp.]|nr:rod-binding protein [Pseudomonas sp.]